MTSIVHIGQAASLLGITREHLRALERAGRIPTPHRDLNGRIYTEFDIALLKSLGVDARPRKLKSVEEVLGGSR